MGTTIRQEKKIFTSRNLEAQREKKTKTNLSFEFETRERDFIDWVFLFYKRNPNSPIECFP